MTQAVARIPMRLWLAVDAGLFWFLGLVSSGTLQDMFLFLMIMFALFSLGMQAIAVIDWFRAGPHEVAPAAQHGPPSSQQRLDETAGENP